jgi:hypothetical protein
MQPDEPGAILMLEQSTAFRPFMRELIIPAGIA